MAGVAGSGTVRRFLCSPAWWLVVWILSNNVAAILGIPIYGLESELNQAQNDPLGETDLFHTLSSSVKRALLKNANTDIKQKMDTLKGFESTTVIHVKLVGFPGGDERGRGGLEANFARYIDFLNQEQRVSVIGSDAHEFLVKSKITVEVTRIGKQLTDKVFKAVKGHFDSGDGMSKASGGRMLYTPIEAVPYEIVDEIIKADLEKPLSSYTVYLLNTGAQNRSYGYEYGPGSTSHYYPKCLGTFWTGKDRYLWVDLAAGPVEYGPSTSGEGYVKGEMFPLAKLYNDRQLQSVYLTDLAAMVWSAARLLFVPSVRIPVPFVLETEVHIIHIQGLNTTDDTKGVDVKVIEEAILKEKESLLLPKQNLKFKYFHMKFLDCPLCAAALTRAQKTFTARVFLERYSLFVDEYLDSKLLHEFLMEFGPVLGMKTQPSANVRVLPVYIMDVDSDRQLLLDRYHQVIPFKDMVIAVRSKASQVVTEYSCNSRPMVAQTRMLERPLVGALLQTVWGVAPTHLSWSPEHNSSLVDYRWAVGQTPFGPFSESVSLSFAQKDAAPRNVLYSMLNQSISTALDLLETIKVFGGGSEKKFFVQNTKHLEFLQRWSLFVYKLNKAVSTISHFEYGTALFFLKSAEHDLIAVHNLVYSAAGEFEAKMNCFRNPPFPWIGLVSILLLLGASVYVWFRRDRLFVNKRKRF